MYESLKTHGMHNTSQYHIWEQIKQRCNNPKNKAYKYYGGVGVSYTSEWESFVGFWEDMKEGYRKGLSIDRVDSDGDYNKSNCRWVTRSQNTKNAHIGRKNTTDTRLKMSLSARTLSDIQIIDIKNRYANGETQVSIAKDYPVSNVTISNIVRGDTYVTFD